MYIYMMLLPHPGSIYLIILQCILQKVKSCVDVVVTLLFQFDKTETIVPEIAFPSWHLVALKLNLHKIWKERDSS